MGGAGTPFTEPSPHGRKEALKRGVSITDTDSLKWEGCQYKCQHCTRHASNGHGTPSRERECDCRSCVCEVVDPNRLWQCPPCGRNNRCYVRRARALSIPLVLSLCLCLSLSVCLSVSVSLARSFSMPCAVARSVPAGLGSDPRPSRDALSLGGRESVGTKA